jgi:hypothetical protein
MSSLRNLIPLRRAMIFLRLVRPPPDRIRAHSIIFDGVARTDVFAFIKDKDLEVDGFAVGEFDFDEIHWGEDAVKCGY